jgi:predicted Zn finger-like uncharacterized protein
MYSQCPDCQARFRVSAEALRAARGTVRCGRCGAAFDALERLSDSVPPPPAEALPATLLDAPLAEVLREPGPEAAAFDDFRFTAEDLDHVFVEARQWPESATPPPARAEPPSDLVEPPVVVVDERVTMEDITLEGERVQIEPPLEPADEGADLDSTDEFEVLREVPDSAYPEDDEETQRKFNELVQQLAEQPTDAPPDIEAAPDDSGAPEPELAPDSVAAAEVAAAADASTVETEPVPLSAHRWRRPDTPDEPEATEPQEPARTAAGTIAWTLLGVALALALGAQLVHHFRQDLVRHPVIGPVLHSAYARFGMELAPNWDLGAFELRQWGNDADAGAAGRMVVRASLTNRASFSQPHPILRLELEDRFGNTVASRDFEPADYLKNPAQASRMIDPGASSEAELALAATGHDAVGYRLDVCLRESAALLRCANGPG